MFKVDVEEIEKAERKPADYWRRISNHNVPFKGTPPDKGGKGGEPINAPEAIKEFIKPPEGKKQESQGKKKQEPQRGFRGYQGNQGKQQGRQGGVQGSQRQGGFQQQKRMGHMRKGFLIVFEEDEA